MYKQALLASLLVALPAAAADGGFTIGLGTGLMKSTVDAPAQIGAYSVHEGHTRPVFAKYGEQMPIFINLGYSTGANFFGIEGTFTSKKADQIEGSKPDVGYFNGPDELAISTKLEANIVDLIWKHAFVQGSGGTLSSILGVRVASFKNAGTLRGTDFSTYDVSGNPLPVAYVSHRTLSEVETKTDAYGLVMGVDYSYPLTSFLSIGGDFRLAFVQGDNKTKAASGYERYRYDGSGNQILQSGSGFRSFESKTEDRTFFQPSLGVHLDWAIIPGLMKASLGYKYMDFGKVNEYAGGLYNGMGPEKIVAGYAKKPSPISKGGASGPAASGWGLGGGLNLGVSFTF